MFGNIGWGEMLVLVVVGLVVLGPERLPGAIRWASNALRQARDYLSGATSQLREDLGPEFEDLKQPLSELQKLRGMTPRAALTKHLLDGDDSWLTGAFDSPEKPHTPITPTPGTLPTSTGPTSAGPTSTGTPASPTTGGPAIGGQALPKSPGPSTPGEPAPFDADAT